MPQSAPAPPEAAATGLDYRLRVQAAVDHAQRNLSRPLTLVELADAAGFSPYHFHRIFAALTGETIGAFVRRLRLEQAAGLLEFTAKSVTRIARETCYDSLEAFSRAFKAHFGLPPTAYRNQAPGIRSRRMDSLGAGAPGPHAARPCLRVSVVTRPRLRVVSVRGQGPYDQAAEQAWEKLLAWAGTKGLLGPHTLCLGIAYDDPGLTAPGRLRYDACLSVGPEVEGEGEVSLTHIEGGEFATATYQGPHENIEQAYVELYGFWLPNSGRMPATRPAFEIYRDHSTGAAPQDLRTDLFVPLEPLPPKE